jgi:hypothetical protein
MKEKYMWGPQELKRKERERKIRRWRSKTKGSRNLGR